MKMHGLIKSIYTRKKGTTLIEVILATLIMLIVVVGGAAFLYHGSSRIKMEANKRVAIEAANSQLEEMRVSDYDDITSNLTSDDDVYYFEEPININGVDQIISTEVQYADPGSDYVIVRVSVGYWPNISDRVTLETYLGPYR